MEESSSTSPLRNLGLKAFISYATADKKIAGQIKKILGQHGVTAFLAHEDIEVSEEWEQRIVTELKETNIFIAMLSSAFDKSEWTAQEVGVAQSMRDILCIPLSLDGTMPRGFMKSIQCERIRGDVLVPALIMKPIRKRFVTRCDTESFVNLARQTRLDRGLTVQEVAQKARLRVNSIRRLESGEYYPTVAEKLARFLGLTDRLPD